jgi:hypothetical protein
VACCLPLVLVPVPPPGRYGPFMQEGNTLVSRRRPAESADASGNRLCSGSPRDGQLALCRRKPLADGARVRSIVALPCLQLA